LWHCFYRVTPSRQTNIRGFGLVPITALLVYLFLLMSVIFTYFVLTVLVTSRRFWIWRHLGYWPGRVGSQVKNPDPIPSLVLRPMKSSRPDTEFVTGLIYTHTFAILLEVHKWSEKFVLFSIWSGFENPVLRFRCCCRHRQKFADSQRPLLLLLLLLWLLDGLDIHHSSVHVSSVNHRRFAAHEWLSSGRRVSLGLPHREPVCVEAAARFEHCNGHLCTSVCTTRKIRMLFWP